MLNVPLAICFAFTVRLHFAVRTKVDSLDLLENLTNDTDTDERPRRGAEKPFHRRRSSWYKTVKKTCNSEPTQCEELVKATLENIECSGVEHIDACIGAVLSSEERDHRLKCCEPGTEYDDFVLADMPAKDDAYFKFDSKTAVFIIDVQRDFTTGSFAQPCWLTGGDSMLEGITNFAKKAAAKGATIIASKDFHPPNHCSFNGESNCQNTKGYGDTTIGPGMRYVNEFPSHCTFGDKFNTLKGVNYSKPQKATETPFCKHMVANVFKGSAPPGHFCGNSQYVGTDLELELAKALKALPPAQVEVVFKGFHKDYESYSATQHIVGVKESCEGCKKFTGGYAMPAKRAKKCHGKWQTDSCHPTDKEMKDPTKKMRSVMQILNEKSIDKIYVTGLVYDYCVKETALFAKEAAVECKDTPGLTSKSSLCMGAHLVGGFNTSVTVVGNLARPSFDGKPGAPYVPAVCDEADGSFCVNGGGTTSAHKATMNDLTEIGVEVVRQKQIPNNCRR